MTISVRRDDPSGTRHRVQIRQHSFTVDASPAGGGKDEGPSPHDLYDASLASCKALTVLLYAQRKGMPLEDLEVQVERDDSQERQGT
ncbi:MAG TPA: OsmC family protein, partial [Variovorax sp.]|nr:OsmC family protein [Variovorax sp.]